MNVDDVIREQIEQARQKAEREKQRRAELAEARKKGLGFRHAAKLRRLAEAAENTSWAASGA
jgi:Arc/MetJ-type ribon-helix-helix transcriptional regulator